MAGAPGKAIKAPDQHHTKLPLLGIIHQLIECRSAVLGAAHTVVGVLPVQVPPSVCYITGRNKMSTTKRISILLIMVGLLLPVVSLGFVKGYNPVLGFVGSIPRMKIVYDEGIGRIIPEKSISYGYFFALGCILVCLGTAGVLFDPKPIDSRGISRHDEQAKSEEQKPETLGKTIPWW